MTNKQIDEKLRAIIIDACPDINCQEGESFYPGAKLFHKEEKKTYEMMENGEWTDGEMSGDIEIDLDEFKIIGHPIQLSHVLRAIGEGYICELSQIKDGKLRFKFDSDEPMFIWTLDKPYEDQPTHTKKALLKILDK